MDTTSFTLSPTNPSSQPHGFLGSPEPSLDRNHRIGTEERPRLACDSCGRRKVKCDRQKPTCGHCVKQHQPCVYSIAQKRPIRRKRYVELRERLENMERVLVDFTSRDQGPAASLRPSLAIPLSLTPVETQFASTIQTMDLCSSIFEDSGFEWDDPEHGLVESSEVEYIRPDLAFLLEPGYATSIAASYPIFTRRGIQWVDKILGDSRFSIMITDMKNTRNISNQSLRPSTLAPHLPPSHSLIEDGVRGYLSTFNRETPLFQDEVILAALNQCRLGTEGLEVGYVAAFNIIIAHANFNCYSSRFRVDSDNYLRIALATVPSIVVEVPDVISIGALLCIVQYLVFSAEYRPATAILGLAFQMIILAGYHRGGGPQNPDTLHQQRLFWHAYIMDNDLSLRLGKPPAITETISVGLPEKSPLDGCGDLEFEDGTVMNFIRERVALAKIQSNTYSMLYSDKALRVHTPQQLYKNLVELDHGLQAWKSSIPELVRPQQHLNDYGVARLTCLTTLHYTYFQLVIAVHSSVFICISNLDVEERKKITIPSIALCVSAARASASLLNYHNYSQPFTKFLLCHVAWSVDILFIHIVQNHTSPCAEEDIALLELVVKFFEKHDPKHANTITYRTTNALYKIALDLVQRKLPNAQLPLGPKSPRRNVEFVPTNSTTEMEMNCNSLWPEQQAGAFPPSIGLDWSIPLGLEDYYWPEENSVMDTTWTGDI
ncbi:hypothetical protein V500_04404 [Pseudogymnoascus sp. VKM F-4518 (FW-2643)]|nr:hypothetical protein V500_04404 [Pseudogymnoascus sp. VKM F-4518 (FW-2643)]